MCNFFVIKYGGVAAEALWTVDKDKNSSKDEIANVNLLRRYSARTSKYQKENLLRLAN